MKAVELFAGVGGFRLGLAEAGITTIFANEWDKYASDTYDKNFAQEGHTIDRRDITTIPASDIPDHDILVGGFPCQAFSVAGKRRGFDEARGTLFFEIARILADKKPQHFLLENVKGLLSHDSGSTFQTIIGILADLGYRVEWCVLNSKDFGVPQNRERIIIVGHLGNGCAGQVFPIGQDHSQATVKTITPEGTGRSERIYTTDGLSPTLIANAGGMGAKTGLYISRVDRSKGIYDLRETETAGALTATMHKGIDASGRTGVIEQGFDTIDGAAHTLDANYYKGLLANQARTGVVDGVRIRRLTPIECERLQGFPDNWTAGVSDTQRYKQMGNAVTVNVIAAVAKQLVNVCGC